MLYRVLFTIATAACLTGLYAAYAVVARPLVVMPELPETSIEPRNQALGHRPIDNVRVAATYLSELPWAEKSQYTLRSGQSFIYTDHWKHDGKSPLITFTPFAMVWLQKDKEGKEQAISLVSDSAQLRFASEFDTINANPGRVVSAVLDGSVQVKGPDGLAIVGYQFIFDESAPSIISTNPVQFEYASHSGSGRSLNVKLIPAEGLPGKDRPHVYGIRTIRLNGGIDPNSKKPMHAKLDLRVPEKDGQTSLVKVRCSGDLELDIPSQTMVFSKDVRAHRPQSNKVDYDMLECDQLKLEFEQSVKETAASPGNDSGPVTAADKEPDFQHIPTDLTFRRLTATGRKVTVKSTQSKLSGEMERLVFDTAQHRLLMTRAANVLISQKQSKLWVPEVELLLHDDNSSLREILCKGEGRLEVSSEESGRVAFAATWAGFLRKSTDSANGLDLVELQQRARFIQSSQKTILEAQLIRVWLDPIPLNAAMASDGEEKPPAVEPKPKRLMAERNVALLSPKLEVKKCDELDVRFEESRIPRELGSRSRGQLKQVGLREQAEPVDESQPSGRVTIPSGKEVDPSVSVRRTSPSPVTKASHRKEDALWPPIEIPNSTDSDPASAEKLTRSMSQPLKLTADRIRVQMQNVEGESQPELVAVETQGHVEIRQRNSAGGPPMTATGDRLILENHGFEREKVHLFGNPAHLRDQRLHVEGREVHLDRGVNRVWVKGKGLLQIPLPKGANIAAMGPITADRDLDVWWDESMEFDGQTAKFLGKVWAEFGLSKMLCEQMDVHLISMISFSEAVRNEEPGLKAIHCRENVSFQNSQYDGSKMVRVIRGRVAEFIHDHELGTSSARGPGEMKFWRRGERSPGGSQRQQMQANRPISPVTAEWDYTRIKFKGRMKGNIAMTTKTAFESQVSTFYDAVDIVHGPVLRMTDEIDSDQLPPDAGSMRCEELEITHHAKGSKHNEDYQQMIGMRNAQIEGKGYYANADEISYDGSKTLYILRAWGNHDATIAHDSAKGPRKEYSGRSIEFNPKPLHIRASNVSGATGP